MTHDFDKQRDETLSVWRDLSAKNNVPKTAILDLQFAPASRAADWDHFETQLTAAGYRCNCYGDGTTLEAFIGPIELSGDAIWQHELATTEIAIACGFRPDGWSFFSGTLAKP